jgi:hypothetical protein
LAGEFGYQDSGEVVGVFDANDPFPIHLQLDALG